MSFGEKIKEDVKNLQVLIEYRNWVPFIRPLILIGVFILVIYVLNGKARDTVEDINRKVEAQKVEAESERDYRAGKTRYQNLLAQLPPSGQKNEWILLQIEAIANKLNLKDTIKYNKGANLPYGILEISTAEIIGELTYSQVGRLVESIENNPQFLRINKLSLDRKDATLGKISIKIEVYTAFLEEHKMVGNTSDKKRR